MERANLARNGRMALACLGALSAATIAAAPAWAHHSFAMFDQKKTVKLDATVVDLQITNPHSWLTLVAPDKAGKQVNWSIEMGGPSQVEAMGLTGDPTKPGFKIKPGDKITVSIHPLTSGRIGGSFVSAMLSDGHEVVQGSRPDAISAAIKAGQN
jgi:hypothetical protein